MIFASALADWRTTDVHAANVFAAVTLPDIPPITLRGVLSFLLLVAIVVFIALGVRRNAIEFHFDRF